MLTQLRQFDYQHGEADLIWYFAYGSNMARTKFRGSRGIKPLASVAATIPGWALTMEVPGMPYSEPGMSSIAPFDSFSDPLNQQQQQFSSTGVNGDTQTIAGEFRRTVHGVAYLITRAQLVAVLASEGGGIAYDDIELGAFLLDCRAADEWNAGRQWVRVHALVNVPSMSRREPQPLPSTRYKGLLVAGAAEAELPAEYQAYLAAWPSYVPSVQAVYSNAFLGAVVFLAIWTPLLAAMERLCYAYLRPRTGQCPRWVKVVVRWGVWAIWWSHDVGFAPIFGRGDGSNDHGSSSAGSLALLIAATRPISDNEKRSLFVTAADRCDEKAHLIGPGFGVQKPKVDYGTESLDDEKRVLLASKRTSPLFWG